MFYTNTRFERATGAQRKEIESKQSERREVKERKRERQQKKKCQRLQDRIIGIVWLVY